MDNRTFNNRLAESVTINPKDSLSLTRALSNIIGQSLAEGDNVAIPGFGTFESTKKDEYVDTDPTTGQRTLMPPQIQVTFKPGSRLKKAITKS